MNFNWRAYAVLTFMFFGLTNFILGYIGEKTAGINRSSISAVVFLWIGMGFMGMISYTVNRCRNGYIFKNPVEGKYLLITAVSGISLSLGMLTLKWGFYTDPFSKGPIVAIISTNSLLVAFMSRAVLKERLNRRQWTGFLIIIAGILFISLSSTSGASILAVMFGLITMGLFAVTNFNLKYLGFKGKNSIQVVTFLWISSGLFGIISFLSGQLLLPGGLLNLPKTYVFISLMSGVLLGSGMLTLKLAVTKGPAGPVVAIAGSNAILVTLLDFMILDKMPISFKLIGMFIAIAGIVISTTGKNK